MEGADAVVNLRGVHWQRTVDPPEEGADHREQGGSDEGDRRGDRRGQKQAGCSAERLRVGYYGDVPSGEVPENSPRGAGFLAETVEQWSRAWKARNSGSGS